MVYLGNKESGSSRAIPSKSGLVAGNFSSFILVCKHRSQGIMSSFYVLTFAFLIYRLAKTVYNVYFHPLAKFPGPKLAAATHLYEFYWSIVRDGEFIWEIERMHKKYGMCIIPWTFDRF